MSQFGDVKGMGVESKLDVRLGAVAVALGLGLLGCPGVAFANDGSAGLDSPATNDDTGAAHRASSAVKSAGGRSGGGGPNVGVARSARSAGFPAGRPAANSRSSAVTRGDVQSVGLQHSATDEGADANEVVFAKPVAPVATPTEAPAGSAAAVSVASAKAAPSAAPVASATASSTGIFAGLLNSFGLGPGSGKGAPPPWDGSVLSGVLEWARREIESLFFNKTPTAAPAQVSQTGDGVIKGTLNAADANGNPLVYEVTSGPSHGTVVIGDDGLYTYTSDSRLAEDGGVDSFVVQVRDTGLHLNFWVPSVISVDVPVAVSANVAPVETESPTMSAPSRSSGLVSGAVHVTDANGNPLTYTVSTSPEKGTVEIDNLGNFTYKPTEAAREAASARNAPDTAKIDFFEISASDGAASLAVPVTVQVAPLDGVQIDAITVGGAPQGIAFSHDGSRAYVANHDGSVSVIDTVSRTVVDTFDVGDEPSALAVSADGTKLYVAQIGTSTVSVYDASSGDLVGSPIDVGSYPNAVVGDPASSHIYVLNSNSGSVAAISTIDNSVTSIPVGNAPSALVFSSDGAKLYVANFTDGTVSTIDTATNTVVGEPITVIGRPSALALSSDGHTLYVTDQDSGSLSLIDLMDLDTKTLVVGRNPSDIAVSADGTRIYVANAGENTVSVIDVATAKVVSDISVGSTPIAMSFSPDGSQIYVVNASSGTVSVISVLENVSNIQFGTHRYRMFNLTAYPVKYLGALWGAGEIDGGPKVGSVIQPGEWFAFELVDPFWSGNSAKVKFEVVGDRQLGYWEVEMELSTFNDAVVICTGWCNTQKDTSYFLNTTPTNIIVPATEQSTVDRLLNVACGESWATCTFDATEQVQSYTDRVQVGYHDNTTGIFQIYDVSYSKTVESSDSIDVGFRAMATIKSVVELELSTTYSHSWGSSATFTWSYTVNVSPYSASRSYGGSPIYINNGNMVLKMGNTTFTMLDQSFVSPDASGRAPYFQVTESPLNKLSS